MDNPKHTFSIATRDGSNSGIAANCNLRDKRQLQGKGAFSLDINARVICTSVKE